MTGTDVYQILAIVLMLLMIFSDLNDMTKGGSVNNLVLLILVARPAKRNWWEIKQDAFVLAKSQQMPIKQSERQLCVLGGM